MGRADFDPEAFDLAAVNATLQRCANETGPTCPAWPWSRSSGSSRCRSR